MGPTRNDPDTPNPGDDAYRRRARRIRARHAHDLPALHRALRGLASEHDARPARDPDARPRLLAPGTVVVNRVTDFDPTTARFPTNTHNPPTPWSDATACSPNPLSGSARGPHFESPKPDSARSSHPLTVPPSPIAAFLPSSPWPWLAHVPPAVLTAFTAEIRSRLDGPVLRGSQRAALARLARRLGLRRFDANLVIAAVQYDAGEQPIRTVPTDYSPTADSSLPWLAAAVLQVTILFVVWWVVF